MKYNGLYFWLFKGPMKQVLAEQYGKQYAHDIMKRSKPLYRKLGLCGALHRKRQENLPGGHPGDDAPQPVPCEMVFCPDGLEH